MDENHTDLLSARVYLAQSFSCKKLSNQKPTADTIYNTRRTTLC